MLPPLRQFSRPAAFALRAASRPAAYGGARVGPFIRTVVSECQAGRSVHIITENMDDSQTVYSGP